MFIANVLQPLIDACEAVLTFWHDLIGDFPNSWGWSIILLTFTVRILILPLTFKGVKAKQRMNQEVMAFYQREKVNPLGSCMPLLLQIPFFIALFYLLRSDSFNEDIADNPGFYAIDNLAEKVTGDPVLLGGLIVHWITTNVWTIGQQLLVRKLYPKPPPRDFEAEAAAEARKPARGKPVEEEEVVGDGAREKPKAAVGGGNGGPREPPPPSPRKKKKRSGRRR